jgi:hypothetical protein
MSEVRLYIKLIHMGWRKLSFGSLWDAAHRRSDTYLVSRMAGAILGVPLDGIQTKIHPHTPTPTQILDLEWARSYR